MYLIGDFLTKLKNAQDAKKESVIFSYSNKIFNIAKILEKNNFVAQVSLKEKNNKRYIKVKLQYIEGFPAINGVKLISKPGRRLYIGYKDIKPIKQRYGLGIISTPLGILNIEEAKKLKVGGEYIAQIW